ncbi:type II restriction enzyme [Lysinibacillus halotolerans]|uniref:Translation elongation factor n=1 Tax=Lysinibacillus halotolerans TaxID=1368476 RepID=A0A3M8HB94_9BACI|nr:translation elongation factor [Lysinibacillus halotolerans]RNC99554.1 translation elongation factor [Lysinibacillus halotolerans]
MVNLYNIDDAWNQLFIKYNITEKVKIEGSYIITAEQIRELGDPILMTTFNHATGLPLLFKQNKLSILPNSSTDYVIGNFSAYQNITYNDEIETTLVPIPRNLESIDPTNIYSDDSVLSCAFVTGMIEDFIEMKVIPTIFGRITSEEFNYTIKTSNGPEIPLFVKDIDMDIQGGFESEEDFLIINAKNSRLDDFLISQMYFPYRYWTSKINKNVRTIFITFSNDIFNFFEYEFINLNNYNSIRLVKQKNYRINTGSITKEDINDLMMIVNFVPEPEIPFPQANSFSKIIDLLSILRERDLNAEDITRYYAFNPRQSDYYTNAAIYLGLIEKYPTYSGKMYRLSKKGNLIMSQAPREKYLLLAESILEHRPFFEVYKAFKKNPSLSNEHISSILKSCNLYNINSPSTYLRRASTVLNWLEWIDSLPNIYS